MPPKLIITEDDDERNVQLESHFIAQWAMMIDSGDLSSKLSTPLGRR